MISLTEPGERLDSWRERLESRLDQLLPAPGNPPRRLHEAMRYAALSGGKRVRPLLTYAAGHALDIDLSLLDSAACAIELVHAYSLIHDDLPAMDDDSLRRGQPTCHMAFDEATAILAGDALQALAFEVLAGDTALPAGIRTDLARDLARACGSTGMAGGQVLDLAATGQRLNLAELEQIHRLKTGALICLAVLAPVPLARADAGTRAALERFGESVGLGFQIRDDVLDVLGDTDLTGKPSHADAARNQPTFPALIGVEGSIARAESLRADAIDCLASVRGDTAPLAWLADYMIRRDR